MKKNIVIFFMALVILAISASVKADENLVFSTDQEILIRQAVRRVYSHGKVDISMVNLENTTEIRCIATCPEESFTIRVWPIKLVKVARTSRWYIPAEMEETRLEIEKIVKSSDKR